MLVILSSVLKNVPIFETVVERFLPLPSPSCPESAGGLFRSNAFFLTIDQKHIDLTK